SGHRTRGRRRSMHRFCKAADIRVAGVRPSQLARFARTIPGINGVGTYRRKSIVHIDTRLQEMVWRY
ncbi:MAG: D-Ala-D-Ala carboxypeptidase family metallohydrolase, partial [Beijerinckiaceae bacterium]|nr:D-Ala-D-Ala carboxypeptidase family metallohydrolase [Beijerinckiaceae bacterium]